MRRPARLALAVLLVAPLASIGAPARAQSTARGVQTSPSAGPSDQSEQTGRLTITDIRPRSPRPGDPFQVLGTITNTSDRPIRDVRARILRGTRIDNRADIAKADDNEDLSYGRQVPSSAVAGGEVNDGNEIAPGATVQVDLRTTVAKLRLDPSHSGVYPLAIRVSAIGDDGSALDLLDEARTYLPWFNDDKVSKIRLAWLVPVVDQPRLAAAAPTPTPNSGRPAEQLVDNDLDALLGKQGRLGSLVPATEQAATCRAPEPQVAPGEPKAVVPAERAPVACSPTPVTFAVDPDLLDTADAMTRPYDVRASNRTVTREPPSVAATSFLAGLKRAVAGSDDVLSLPFADADVVALAGSPLKDQVAQARDLGRERTTQLLGAPLDSVTLAPPGPVTDAALDAFRSDTDNTRAVVLDPAALARKDEGITKDTRVSLATARPGLSGLVVDEGLSNLLRSDPGEDAGTDPRLLQQRWLVETAMIAAERPNDARTVLVELPRRTPVDPQLIRAALADTGRVPWMCAVTLDAVAQGTDSCPAEPVRQDQAERNPDLTRDGTLASTSAPDLGASLTPLSVSVLDKVSAESKRADRFTGAILAGGTTSAGSTEAASTRLRLQREVLRTLSTAWRTAPGGQVLTQRLTDDLDAAYAKISLRASKVLLTSKDSRLEVAVINGLTQPIQVLVQLEAGSEARLTVEKPKLVTVPAGTTLPVLFKAKTASPGRFVVTARLLDRNWRPNQSEAEQKASAFAEKDLPVRSTRYGTLALAVTGIAAAVLLVAAGLRLTRRALRAGRRRRARA